MTFDSDENILGKQLNCDYLNYSDFNQINISENISENNINNVKVKVINNVLKMTWDDAVSKKWKSNIIVRCENIVPATVYAGNIVGQYSSKHQYKDVPFEDANIVPNTLYCYRMFTEFENSSDYYSGLKNIIFVYVFKSDFDFSVITAGMVLTDSQRRFVSDEQIELWNRMASELDTYTKAEIDEMFSRVSSITPEERIKLELIDKPGFDKYTITQNQINLWNNKENSLNKGKENGYASLDSNGKVPVSQIPKVPAYIAKGSSKFAGEEGVIISIPEQLNTSYCVLIQPSGESDLDNPSGYLGEIFVKKQTDKIVVCNTGSAVTKFDYIIM